MSILINKKTKVIVQGMTGRQGSFHSKLMREYGTDIVAGVTPRKGGQKLMGKKIYDHVGDVFLAKKDADWSIIFVPAKFAKDAAIEALNSNLNVAVITEGIPVHDSIEIMRTARKRKRAVIGPNCPGLITPGECKLGIMPSHIFKKGKVGIVSRSGTLTYEIVDSLSKAGIGQSTVVGIGGDPVIGMDFIDCLRMFEDDPGTEKIVLIGEIGGDAEEKAADFISENMKKPVVAYIAGQTAPEGKRMGHAGAVISGKAGTAQGKIKSLEAAGVKVAKLPSEIVGLLA